MLHTDIRVAPRNDTTPARAVRLRHRGSWHAVVEIRNGIVFTACGREGLLCNRATRVTNIPEINCGACPRFL